VLHVTLILMLTLKNREYMYTWAKDIVKWRVGKTLYLSVPFTWLVKEAERIAAEHDGKVLIGGPGLMKPTECPGYTPLLFHNPLATFTTRGCPNRCPFCAVHKLEPEFIEIPDFRPAPVICDNNLLAASKRHIARVIDRLTAFPFVDFNQGLEARKFTPAIADMLGRLHCKVRFAFDTQANESELKRAIDLCQSRTTNDISVYCLIGFNDSPDEAINRLETVKLWGARPFPMRYQPLDTWIKNSYVAPGWTDTKLRDVASFYSLSRYLEYMPFEEYEYRRHNGKRADSRQSALDI
jgi:hypothetical protein